MQKAKKPITSQKINLTQGDKGWVDDYKIIKHLGAGGFANVKKVEKDGELFAMKIFQFHPEEKARNLESLM